MEFRHGAVVRLPPPPLVLPAHPLRVTCLARPTVAQGDFVQRGQVLCDPDDRATPCAISPIDGHIKDITRWRLEDGRHLRYDVSIDPGDVASVPQTLGLDPPRTRTLVDWQEALRKLGPWSDHATDYSSGRHWFGLIEQLEAARHRPPDTLICVGLDPFPPYPDRSSILDTFADDAVLGTQILADIFGASKMLIIASMRGAVVNRLKRSCKNFRVPLVAATNLYPTADPTLVIWAHASGKRRLPYGMNPIERGVALISPWSAVRVARWFTHREIDLARPVMIGWPDARESMTTSWALPGQPLASLHGALSGSAAAMSGRVISGNPMTGRPISTPRAGGRALAPVVPADELVFSVLASAAPPPREACITCGWCAEVCPTRLRPIHLADHVERKKLRERDRQALEYCIDCGLCTHVCPSHIPIAQILREARDRLE